MTQSKTQAQRRAALIQEEAFERRCRTDHIFCNLFDSFRQVSEERIANTEAMQVVADVLASLCVNILEHEINTLLERMEASYV